MRGRPGRGCASRRRIRPGGQALPRPAGAGRRGGSPPGAAVRAQRPLRLGPGPPGAGGMPPSRPGLAPPALLAQPGHLPEAVAVLRPRRRHLRGRRGRGPRGRCRRRPARRPAGAPAPRAPPQRRAPTPPGRPGPPRPCPPWFGGRRRRPTPLRAGGSAPCGRFSALRDRRRPVRMTAYRPSVTAAVSREGPPCGSRF